MYSTLTDIEEAITPKRLNQLTSNDGLTLGSVIVTNAIEKASSEIDGYLRGLLTVPLVVVPEIIKLIHIDFTIYYLYFYRNDANIPDAVRQNYIMRKEELNKIREGKIKLVPVVDKSADTPISKPQSINKQRVFDSTFWKNY